MESQPQNPEFRKNPENFHPWPCPTTMAFAIGQNRISHLMSLYIYMYIHNRPNKKIGVVQVTRPSLIFYPLP